MSLNRQERRRFAKEMTRRGDTIVARGLAPKHPREDVLALGLVLKVRLTDRRQPKRASRTALFIEDLLQRSLAAHPAPEKIACAKGCAHCCRGVVSATVPEILLVAERVRNSTSQAIERAGERLLALKPGEPVSPRRPCLLLDQDVCSVYDVRPLSCRHLHSSSLEACPAARRSSARTRASTSSV